MAETNEPSKNRLPRDLITEIVIGQHSLFVRDDEGLYHPADNLNPLFVTSSEDIPVTTFSPSDVVMLNILSNITDQLKLLNMRVEEAFQTRINEKDL